MAFFPPAHSFKIPFATLLLAALVSGAYFFLSKGAPYIPGEIFFPFAAITGAGGEQTGLFSHLFLHVGLQHLIGNVLPLLLFGALVELAVGSLDVLAIFLISGVLSGALFSFLNPSTPLAGASAAVSGLMGAALVAKPRHALVLLVAAPLVLGAIFLPAVNLASEKYSEEISQKAVSLNQTVQILVQQNRTEEAIGVSKQLVEVQKQAQQIETGAAREKESQTSLAVHLFGAILGVAYLYAFRRRVLETGKEEFAKLGEAVYNAAQFVRERLGVK